MGEKLKNKTFEEITAVSVIDIPKCQLTPSNGRIFITSVDAGEQKTAGGVIIPNKFNNDPQKEKSTIERKRYYVVAVADDVPVKDVGKKLEMGDEVFLLLMPDAIGFDLPYVIDYYTRNTFDVIHYTELAAIGASATLQKEE